jgi:hypothetical protein
MMDANKKVKKKPMVLAQKQTGRSMEQKIQKEPDTATAI